MDGYKFLIWKGKILVLSFFGGSVAHAIGMILWNIPRKTGHTCWKKIRAGSEGKMKKTSKGTSFTWPLKQSTSHFNVTKEYKFHPVSFDEIAYSNHFCTIVKISKRNVLGLSGDMFGTKHENLNITYDGDDCIVTTIIFFNQRNNEGYIEFHW